MQIFQRVFRTGQDDDSPELTFNDFIFMQQIDWWPMDIFVNIGWNTCTYAHCAQHISCFEDQRDLFCEHWNSKAMQMKCASLNAVFSEKPQTTFCITIQEHHPHISLSAQIFRPHSYELLSYSLVLIKGPVQIFLPMGFHLTIDYRPDSFLCRKIYFVTKSRNKGNPMGLNNSEQHNILREEINIELM